MAQVNYQKICQKILKDLPERQKAVLGRRFGLAGNQPETLQAIGNDYKITRERVRQIEREAFNGLKGKKKDKEIETIFVDFGQTLKKAGGLKREDTLLNSLSQDNLQKAVRFLLCLSPTFSYFPENEETFSFWSVDQKVSQKARTILTKVSQKLSQLTEPISEGAFLSMAKKEAPHFLLSIAEISKKIERGPLGDFGLIEWPEIKPKGVRDAAFIALKKEKQPLHFRQIAQVASNLVSDCLGGRVVLPQTVHNELIRDPRFILVGRGVYGLSDWGYQAGTVKEVISDVLKSASNPLSKEDILQAVQKQRLVKANTVFLNLADKSRFLKNSQGKYTLEEV